MNKATLSAALSAAILGMMGGVGVATNATDIAFKNGSSAEAKTTKAKPNKNKSSQRAMASIFGGTGITRVNRRNPGPGWSNRQVQRMARKRRSVKANRKNHKG